MRSVSEHLAAVLAAARPVAQLDVVLGDAAGCILAEDVTVGADVPPWPVAACDGYALRAEDAAAPEGLPVLHDVPVTARERLRLVTGTAVLVAAGAPLPLEADAVVPLERTDRGRARVVVRGAVTRGDHVRRPGEDAAVGAVVLEQGTRLSSRHLAVAATVGRARLRVHPTPRVVVVAVGDELVEPGRGAGPGRTVDANGPALVAAVRDAGAHAVRVGPVPDDRAGLREVLADQLVRADLILVTGGLSAGPWDTVTDVLAPSGTVRFDEVAMSPGRRHGFGVVAATGPDEPDPDWGAVVRPPAPEAPSEGDDDDVAGVPVIALPGHPAAALVAFEVFVRPALLAMGGHTELFRPSLRASAAQGWRSPAGRRQFVPVRLAGAPTSGYVATPVGDPDRPALADLAGADALAVVAEAATEVAAGDVLGCLVLDS